MGHQWSICFIANITLTVAGKLNTQIKELQARLEELDEELESERAARARADKGRGQLRRELDELHQKQEETGSNTAAQIALNTRREEELAKLKMELDECNSKWIIWIIV